ncbi:SMI1/KNR4 family protein SUKH-1 [Chitinophaga dinghuensis]|uniref:SMI1/KNR4 family protein SUKH-1 n=1 Tax=Chitinophaga dinghuensis TaxID=1539050 RepID=A0A327WE21_9BACT|nr:SMI1/KNR4 family protein [Chitinophaga dinghuensis]RAJ87610.1 SMI1/KNR4 family protein SUKH-1 [Chitinophaga dinghuensis]
MTDLTGTSFHKLAKYADCLGTFSGISAAEILELEKKIGYTLPKVYKEFLSIFGKSSGYVFPAHYATYPEVLENRTDAIHALYFTDSIPDAERPIIKPSYYFFAQWQGYNFWFFDCEEKQDDPIVYLFTDRPRIAPTNMTFTQVMYSEGLYDAGMGV